MKPCGVLVDNTWTSQSCSLTYMYFHPDCMPSALQLKVYVGGSQKPLADL